MNFLLVSFCSTALLVLIEPFIALWLGRRFLFGKRHAAADPAVFFTFSMRRVIFLARDSAGLYQPDRYMPLVETVVNLGLAVLLVQHWGVNGVLVANLVSMLLIPSGFSQTIVYKGYFRPFRQALFRPVCSVFSGHAAGGRSYLRRMPVHSAEWNLWLILLARGVLCLIIPNAEPADFLPTPEGLLRILLREQWPAVFWEKTGEKAEEYRIDCGAF